MKAKVVIVAPYPDMKFVNEGWMSRIRAIDNIFNKVSRAYVNFGDHHRKGVDGDAVPCEKDVVQYNLNAKEPAHQLIFDRLVTEAAIVYVHTVHLAINVVGWLPTGKVIVDIHGIVPEEEVMLGRPEQALIYTPVEEAVLRDCKNLVVVTNAMRGHLIRKYPQTQSRFIVLPIFERYTHTRKFIDLKNNNDDKLKVVYAGGSQVWQNVELMMEMVKETIDDVSFTFLTHDKEVFERKAAAAGVLENVTIKTATKAELPQIYAEHDLGFVLRDGNPVNTVSCPTKLSEYMDFGIVPIVKYQSLGDFETFGYSYITEDEFRNLFLPDATTRNKMIQNNYRAIQKLIHQFKIGSQELLALIEK